MLHAIVRGEVAPPPITHTLAYGLAYVGDGEATFEIEPAEFHFNPLGTVHGGVISTVLDSSLGCAVQTKLPEGVSYTTIDLNVTFVRPVTLATGRLSCPAEVVNVGRRVGAARSSPGGRRRQALRHRHRHLPHLRPAVLSSRDQALFLRSLGSWQASSRPKTRLRRPKAIQRPMHMLSSTSSASVKLPFRRAKNSSSMPWWSRA